MTTAWTINEIAKRTSLSKDTIRYYEKEKLISPKRAENNYRVYSEEELLKLKYISVMKYAQFSIKEIKGFMGLFDQELSEECNQEGMTLLNKKIRDLELVMHHYQSILTLLKQLPYPGTFQQLTEELGTGNARRLDGFIEQLFDEIKEEPYEDH
ncbi:MerR family transcriptional regulator [Enterococcus sp. BWM-S5]|uniref:MerR family transcriptional regulator n=1 Tax=Enterococcus larvae TaxID=2794352 RepID=A0ABS4CN41_9ENTE|nr:MerR family transcriptional regulator [Enterococcus larvae]MBP1047923.1 MerR family transcriptional regulator [Enterococcus larvae]